MITMSMILVKCIDQYIVYDDDDHYVDGDDISYV